MLGRWVHTAWGAWMSVLGAARARGQLCLPPGAWLGRSGASAAVRCAWPGSSVQISRLLRRRRAVSGRFPVWALKVTRF